MDKYRNALNFSEKIAMLAPWMLLAFCGGLFAGYAWAMYPFGGM